MGDEGCFEGHAVAETKSATKDKMNDSAVMLAAKPLCFILDSTKDFIFGMFYSDIILGRVSYSYSTGGEYAVPKHSGRLPELATHVQGRVSNISTEIMGRQCSFKLTRQMYQDEDYYYYLFLLR